MPNENPTTAEEVRDFIKCGIDEWTDDDIKDTYDLLQTTRQYLDEYADLLDKIPGLLKEFEQVQLELKVTHTALGRAIELLDEIEPVYAKLPRLGDRWIAIINEKAYGVGHKGMIFGPIRITEIQGNGIRGCEQNGSSIYVPYKDAFHTLAGAEARVKELNDDK